jgi:hypothetical protein
VALTRLLSARFGGRGQEGLAPAVHDLDRKSVGIPVPVLVREKTVEDVLNKGVAQCPSVGAKSPTVHGDAIREDDDANHVAVL